MPETIQVIRVDRVDRDAPLTTRTPIGMAVTFFDDNNQRWAITGDVIELTEQREPAFGSSGRMLRRLVGEWTATDA